MNILEWQTYQRGKCIPFAIFTFTVPYSWLSLWGISHKVLLHLSISWKSVQGSPCKCACIYTCKMKMHNILKVKITWRIPRNLSQNVLFEIFFILKIDFWLRRWALALSSVTRMVSILSKEKTNSLNNLTCFWLLQGEKYSSINLNIILFCK